MMFRLLKRGYSKRDYCTGTDKAMFTLHSQLAADTILVGDLPLSTVLLSKDANYPWCILVPRRVDIREIHHLEVLDQQQLLLESCALAAAMEALFEPVKMNIAALGNQVPQLHIHHIARFADDAAWPRPVWDQVPSIAYSEPLLVKRIEGLRKHLLEADLRVEAV